MSLSLRLVLTPDERLDRLLARFDRRLLVNIQITKDELIDEIRSLSLLVQQIGKRLDEIQVPIVTMSDAPVVVNKGLGGKDSEGASRVGTLRDRPENVPVDESLL